VEKKLTMKKDRMKNTAMKKTMEAGKNTMMIASQDLLDCVVT